jgi:hypothetical protein
MKTINVKIDDQSTYSITIQDDYNLSDFITIFEGHLLKLRKFSELDSMHTTRNPVVTKHDRHNDSVNLFFDNLSKHLNGLGNDIERKDKSTMRAYYSISKSRKKKLGLAWLVRHSKHLLVYLRKGEYSNMDLEGKIIYHSPEKKTFGQYPYMKVHNQGDLDYLVKIIENIYNQ